MMSVLFRETAVVLTYKVKPVSSRYVNVAVYSSGCRLF